MNQERSLLIGFDLGEDCSQISCFNRDTFMPESICSYEKEEKYLIPTRLGVRTDTKEWVFGEEVEYYEKLMKVTPIDHIMECIEKEAEIEILGTVFSGISLLEKYFRKCFNLLKKNYAGQTIKKLVITVREYNSKVNKAIMEALSRLGIQSDRAAIISYDRSYLYYALSQKKELWMNDVSLFDYDEEGLKYYQLSINRKTSPMTVGIIKKDFSDTMGYDLLRDRQDDDNLKYIFENITKSVLHKQIISTIYVTGKGFDGNWPVAIFQELCAGRRVFFGQNLYTKGACYAARELAGEGKLNDFIILSNDMITNNISVKVYYDAKDREVLVLKAGTVWNEADKRIHLILDHEDEIQVKIKDIITGETKVNIMALEGLPKRPNRTTRVELRARYIDSETCQITVKDLGFGEFYSSSNRIWEKVI